MIVIKFNVRQTEEEPEFIRTFERIVAFRASECGMRAKCAIAGISSFFSPDRIQAVVAYQYPAKSMGSGPQDRYSGW